MEEYSFHPSNIVHLAKAAAFIVAMTAIALLLRQFIDPVLAQVIAGIWIIGIGDYAVNLIILNSYTVTLGEKDITYSYGIFARNEIVLPYSKISESRYMQTVTGRILGLGTLKIVTPGITDEILLPNVRMADIKRTLDEVQQRS